MLFYIACLREPKKGTSGSIRLYKFSFVVKAKYTFLTSLSCPIFGLPLFKNKALFLLLFKMNSIW